MHRLGLARALLLTVVAPLAAIGPAAAAPGDPGTYSFTNATYSADLAWAGLATDGVVLSGTIEANGIAGTFKQTLVVGEVFLTQKAPMPVLVNGVTTTADSLRLEVWLPVAEVSGNVTLTFAADSIAHRSEFHLTNGGFAPTIRSVTRVAWSHAFETHGSVDPESGDVTFDEGQSLDAYGEWEDTHRYGVFLNDPGGVFVGHARVSQGNQANYLNEGVFRAGIDYTEVTSWFNGFLDYGSAGLMQPVWTSDVIALMPAGSTPGAFSDLIESYGAFVPPSPGDLTGDGQVVIAIADTGVNPYHEDFRNPAISAHPSTYLSGYQAATPALNLTFGSSYANSRNADDAAVWSQVNQGKLYWIPGTKIIGAYSIGDAPVNPVPSTEPPPFPERFIIDDVGHGTGTASVAAGYRFGICEGCLLVIIEGTSAGVAWASAQPWIDIISNSYGPVASLPIGDSNVSSLAAYHAGKSVLYSSGNGFSGAGLAPDRNPSFTRPTSGPSWVITVGAASPRNDQEHSWYGVPSDVISYGSGYPAAANHVVSGEQVFTGTSCATPIVAGVEGSLLLHARRTLGDAAEGTSGGTMASLGSGTAPASGPMANGILTRDELEEVLQKTAIPTAVDPLGPVDVTTVPGTPASFLTQGYGLVNRDSLTDGVDVLDGVATLPARAAEQTWIDAGDAVRDAIWGAP